MIEVKYSYARGQVLNLLFSLVGPFYIFFLHPENEASLSYYLNLALVMFVGFSPIMLLFMFLANRFTSNTKFSKEGIYTDKGNVLLSWEDVLIDQSEKVELRWPDCNYSIYIKSKKDPSIHTLLHINFLNEKSAMKIAQEFIPKNNILSTFIQNYKMKRKIKS